MQRTRSTVDTSACAPRVHACFSPPLHPLACQHTTHYSNHQTQLPLAYKYEAIVPPSHSSVIICYLLLFITMKLLTATLALFLLLLTSSCIQTAMAGSAFCDSKCKVRCSKASVQDRCLKYCGVCCQACHCVPSGTYGNKDECPCYRDKVTNDKKRKPKCP